MRTLNLGILAHVDAGKTTLTERLLYTAGVVADVGRVDDGSTQTDTLALERQRGITIKSAVVSFVIDDVAVNLIDTPGHPDFIAEVDRVLSVLDGAVLVVSAVKGVQPQTRVLMRALQRLRVPTLIFVNKLDCAGAEYDAVVQSVAERLATASIAMGLASGLGSAEASFAPYDGDDDGFATELVDLLTDHDDGLLTDYVEDERAVSYRHLRVSLATQTKQARVHPAFFGSAATGAGVDELVSGITELLPAAQGRADGPGSGTVFKVARGPAGQRIAYVRMSSGTIRVRDRVQSGQATSGRVTAIRTFDRGGDVSVGSIAAGQIGMVWGLGDVRIGDVVGEPGTTSPVSAHHFAPPTLETVVSPTHATDKGALHAALTQLAEQDPLINLRQDDSRQEMSLSLYGEVQKEVIQATLADEFGLEVSFSETTQICIERPVGTGSALETIAVDRNPFLATVGLRVEPGPVGSGLEFRLKVEPGSMPPALFTAVEEAVKETLREGLSGWEVIDCTVTMTSSGYWARQSHSHGTFDASMSSTAGDFRNLTPLVLMSALKAAGTTVYEPINRFRLEAPDDTLGQLLPVLARLRAVPQTSAPVGSTAILEGEIPAARVHDLQLRLPSLTSGEGVLECAFERYERVRGTVPTRPRSDRNPLERREYLLRVAGRA